MLLTKLLYVVYVLGFIPLTYTESIYVQSSHEPMAFQYAFRQNCKTAANCLRVRKALPRIIVKLYTIHILQEAAMCAKWKQCLFRYHAGTRNNLVCTLE